MNKTLIFFLCLMALSITKIQAEELSNYQQGQNFLLENAKKDGVLQMSSGLQYKIIKQGKGQFPSRHNTVKVKYEGKHLNGKVFDSNMDKRAIKFRLDQVIKGWTEGLTKISEGGRIMLYIPPELAYGAYGSPPSIGRNETLIFTVDLIRVY